MFYKQIIDWATGFTNSIAGIKDQNGGIVGRDGSGNASISGTLTANTLKVSGAAGTTQKIAGFDTSGNLITNFNIIPLVLTDATTVTNITTETNWNGQGAYTGPAISAAYQQQVYTDGNYFYFFYNDTTPYRMVINKQAHIAGSTAAPSIAAGTGAGTSPTVSAITGHDMAGIITLTTGTLPAASAVIATVTFAKGYTGNGPRVLLEACNANAMALTGTARAYVPPGGESTTQFQIYSGSTALTAATQYQWKYLIIQG